MSIKLSRMLWWPSLSNTSYRAKASTLKTPINLTLPIPMGQSEKSNSRNLKKKKKRFYKCDHIEKCR